MPQLTLKALEVRCNAQDVLISQLFEMINTLATAAPRRPITNSQFGWLKNNTPLTRDQINALTFEEADALIDTQKKSMSSAPVVTSGFLCGNCSQHHATVALVKQCFTSGSPTASGSDLDIGSAAA